MRRAPQNKPSDTDQKESSAQPPEKSVWEEELEDALNPFWSSRALHLRDRG